MSRRRNRESREFQWTLYWPDGPEREVFQQYLDRYYDEVPSHQMERISRSMIVFCIVVLSSCIFVVFALFRTNLVDYGIMPYDPGEPNHSDFEWQDCVESHSRYWVELGDSGDWAKFSALEYGPPQSLDLKICFHTRQLPEGISTNFRIWHDSSGNVPVKDDYSRIDIYCQTPGDYSFYEGEDGGRTLDNPLWGNSTRYWSGLSYAGNGALIGSSGRESFAVNLPADSFCQLRATMPESEAHFELTISAEELFWAGMGHNGRFCCGIIFLFLLIVALVPTISGTRDTKLAERFFYEGYRVVFTRHSENATYFREKDPPGIGTRLLFSIIAFPLISVPLYLSILLLLIIIPSFITIILTNWRVQLLLIIAILSIFIPTIEAWMPRHRQK